MKKFISLLLVTLILISCQKLFKQDAMNDYKITTQSDLENALAGLYYKMANAIKMTADANSVLIGNEDDLIVITSQGANTVEPFYSASYKAIICANDIIEKSASLTKNSQTLKLLGEVYFLRGWCYFNLARSFGQPPLVLSTNLNFNLTKPTYSQVYDAIENDLQLAINYLPASFNESRIKYITPTRGTAKSLMAEVLLTSGGYPVNDPMAYTKAWKIASEVIDSAATYNYSLLPDFADLWNGKHNMNPEGVFALFYLTAGWNANGKPFDSLTYTPAFKNIMNFDWSFYAFGYLGISFYNNFPKQYRKDNTYQTYIIEQKINQSQQLVTDTVYIDSLKPNSFVSIKKYFNAVDSFALMGPFDVGNDINNVGSSFYEGNTLYFLRYAHTLLTYAEAKARDGQLDATAYEAVNKVRRRAYKVDINNPSKYDLKGGLSSEQFIDSVIHERACEFCGEPFNRWCDLLRLNVLNMKQLVAPFSPYPIAINANNFYDIPVSETLLEPGLK